MIDQSSEGGADVVDVLEDIFERKIDAQVPYLEEVPEQCGTKIYWWILLVAARGAGFGYVYIGGAEVVRVESRGAVDDEASFSFSKDPRNGRDEKAKDEESEEPREEKMVGEFFFLDELLANVLFVFFERWVVVIVDALVRVLSGALEDAGGRYSFGADAVAQVDVNGRVAVGCRHISQSFEGSEGTVPIPMSGSILATKPANEVAVVEIEGDEGLAKKFGTLVQREGGVVGVVPRQAK
jgi:hypothetical protein